MNLPSYSVLIPAYNAQDTIGELIEQLHKVSINPDSIIIINDGSTDKTSEIVKSKNTIMFDLKNNSGKGSALKRGFDIFLTKTDSRYVLCMDADLQHPTSSIESFLERAEQENCSIVIGNRKFIIGQMPFLRYLSNTITSFILSKITGQKIKDSQCGFRLIKREVLNNFEMKENGFQFESEFILNCARENLQIGFVNIPTIYNHYGSNINHFKDTYKFTHLIIKEIYKKWFLKNNVKK